MEKSSTLPLDNVAGALAQAVTWAQASIPVGLLPQWVFVANIALAEQRGYTVGRGSARSPRPHHPHQYPRRRIH